MGHSERFRYCLTSISEFIGRRPDAQYNEYQVSLAPGDRLFFYTDGIYDVKSLEDKRLGIRKVQKILADAVQGTRVPSVIVDQMNISLSDFRRGAELIDDVTFFVAELK